MKPTPILFVALLCGLPLVQAAIELSNGKDVQALEIFGPIEEARLRQFEDDLRDASIVHKEVAPWLQLYLTKLLNRGNEKAVVGRDGSLHLAADLDSISSASYLDREPNAVDTIVDFKEQLAAQGVQLLLLPTPEKTAIVPQTLSTLIETEQIPHPDTAKFFQQLDEAGVETINLFEFYRTLPEPLYFDRDTHWTVETMESVASEIARRANELAEIPKTRTWRTETTPVLASGDLMGMLNYPVGYSPWLMMPFEIHKVLDSETGEPFEKDRTAPVLLLGDSFTLAFSASDLGLGSNAGLAEHLAKELSAPVDVIAAPGGASREVRENLARREEVVTGKSVVIWQFSMRDLPVKSNRWEKVDLGEPKVAPLQEGQIEVSAEIVEVTRVDNFEYAFGLAIFEYRVTQVHAGESEAPVLWIAHIAVQDFKGTEAANFEVGDKHRLVLEPVEKHYDLESTSWADDTDSDFDIWFPVRRVN